MCATVSSRVGQMPIQRPIAITWHLTGKFAWRPACSATIGWTAPLASRLSIRFQVLEAVCAVMEQLHRDGPAQITEVVGPHIAEDLAAVLATRASETRVALDSLRAAYPDYASALEKRGLQQTAMRLEQGHYKDMLSNSVIGKEVYSNLVGEMASRYFGSAAKAESGPWGLSRRSWYRKCRSLPGLARRNRLPSPASWNSRLALPGELIVRKGDPGDAMYFISSGALRVDLPAGPVILGSGDIFGEMALLSDQPRVADVVAEGFCELLVLQTGEFHQILDQDANLKAEIERVAAERTQNLE